MRWFAPGKRNSTKKAGEERTHPSCPVGDKTTILRKEAHKSFVVNRSCIDFRADLSAEPQPRGTPAGSDGNPRLEPPGNRWLTGSCEDQNRTAETGDQGREAFAQSAVAFPKPGSGCRRCRPVPLERGQSLEGLGLCCRAGAARGHNTGGPHLGLRVSANPPQSTRRLASVCGRI